MYKNYQNFDTLAALDANAFMRQGVIPIASLAERNALTAHKGMTIVRTDLNNREERFDGLNWITTESGLVLVYPTAVTGTMTLQADGSVGGTNVTTGRANISGVFSSRYSRYRIVTTVSGKASVNATCDAIVRTGTGTDISVPEYFIQQATLNSGNPTNAATGNSTSLRTIFDDAGAVQLFTTDVYISDKFALFNSSFVGRGGIVSSGQKTGSIEGLSSRPTGLGIDWGQKVDSVNMRFYAYA